MFSKASRCKVNIQKSIVFIYATCDQLAIENFKKSTIYSNTKKHEILRYKSHKISVQSVCYYKA